ncbi:hypothetical protein IJ579_06125 [bacterium]|nr:hypothetical protein [bacterium]
MIRISPLKPRPLPDKLIYVPTGSINDSIFFQQFKIFSTKTGDYGGFITLSKSEAYINGKMRPSLYIDHLFSARFGKGFGTALLDFARTVSKKVGCEGRIHLCADGYFRPNAIPHVFYRRYGMNTGIEEIDKVLDKFVQKRKNARYTDFSIVEMYYPPVTYEKTETIYRKSRNYLD